MYGSTKLVLHKIPHEEINMEVNPKVTRKIEIEGVIKDKYGNVKETFYVDEKGEKTNKEVK